MAKVSIYIDDSYVKRDGTCSIYIRTRINKKYVLLPAGVEVPPANFDKGRQAVIGKGAREKNLILKEASGRVADILLRYQVNKKTITREALEREFYNPAATQDFCAYMLTEIKKRVGVDLTERSRDHHLTTLRKFQKFLKRNDLAFVELDYQLLERFYRYLKSNLKNKTNTAHNEMKTLKVYILKAKREGLITENPYDHIRLKKEKTYPEFLDENELHRLWALYHSNKLLYSHKNVVRWFLFSTETGLRISDVRNIRHGDIRNGTLVFTPQKTRYMNNTRVDVPLTSQALMLIDDEGNKGEFLFACYSEARMRKYLKESLPLAGISKDLSFHAGRHTFATQFLRKFDRANGILILQKLLGHAKLESTMVYLHVLNDDIIEAMQVFEEKTIKK